MHAWVGGWRGQFDRDQKRPSDGPDVAGWLGWAAGIAAIPAFGAAPPIGYGLVVLAGGALARKEVRRRQLDKRDQLAARVRDELQTKERMLR